MCKVDTFQLFSMLPLKYCMFVLSHTKFLFYDNILPVHLAKVSSAENFHVVALQLKLADGPTLLVGCIVHTARKTY